MTSSGPVTKRRKGSTAHPIPIRVQDGDIRQTRISFEVEAHPHPSLLIDEDIISMIERIQCQAITASHESVLVVRICVELRIIYFSLFIFSSRSRSACIIFFLVTDDLAIARL